MKKILASAVLSIVLASPAFAQAYSAGYGTGNIINQPALGLGGFTTGSTNDAYAYAPSPANAQLRGIRAEAVSPNDPDTVYVDGQYVGRDPDPNVRLELRRDWMHE